MNQHDGWTKGVCSNMNRKQDSSDNNTRNYSEELREIQSF